MVAPPRGEAQLLAGAKVLEDILGVRGTTPIDPRAPKHRTRAWTAAIPGAKRGNGLRSN